MGVFDHLKDVTLTLEIFIVVINPQVRTMLTFALTSAFFVLLASYLEANGYDNGNGMLNNGHSIRPDQTRCFMVEVHSGENVTFPFAFRRTRNTTDLWFSLTMLEEEGGNWTSIPIADFNGTTYENHNKSIWNVHMWDTLGNLSEDKPAPRRIPLTVKITERMNNTMIVGRLYEKGAAYPSGFRRIILFLIRLITNGTSKSIKDKCDDIHRKASMKTLGNWEPITLSSVYSSVKTLLLRYTNEELLFSEGIGPSEAPPIIDNLFLDPPPSTKQPTTTTSTTTPTPTTTTSTTTPTVNDNVTKSDSPTTPATSPTTPATSPTTPATSPTTPATSPTTPATGYTTSKYITSINDSDETTDHVTTSSSSVIPENKIIIDLGRDGGFFLGFCYVYVTEPADFFWEINGMTANRFVQSLEHTTSSEYAVSSVKIPWSEVLPNTDIICTACVSNPMKRCFRSSALIPCPEKKHAEILFSTGNGKAVCMAYNLYSRPKIEWYVDSVSILEDVSYGWIPGGYGKCGLALAEIHIKDLEKSRDHTVYTCKVITENDTIIITRLFVKIDSVKSSRLHAAIAVFVITFTLSLLTYTLFRVILRRKGNLKLHKRRLRRSSVPGL
ncbi:envelope glycoprotein J [Spheniscid alphaherpesvirus 1]|uniref:Envelope glycoprotein J n=1 Tax=Spheniscid alphaherpesvirus 1 TaxID=2560777 RepID=A0A1R3T8E2_9ALPH|nr:envelope glycoprotein J [Spheniscid alphaherpesvirus 1]SCO83640.1 envelope glycoprotein J [Spheniscid alphaherpesvirus 1]